MIDLGVGQPNNAILPVDYMRRAAMLQFGESPEFLQYGAEWGDGHHRLALGEFLSESYGVPVAPEQLFSTNGNSQALEMLCTVMTEPGDVVIVEEPTYFLAFQMFRDHGLEIRGVPLDDEGLVVDACVEAVERVRARGQARGVHVHDPRVPEPDRHHDVGDSAGRRARGSGERRSTCCVVADEVYHLLRYAPGPMPPPMSAFVDEAPMLSIGTFSKILAPGMRLGWIHGSLERLARARRLRADPQRRRAQPRHLDVGDGDDAYGLAAGVPRLAASHVRPPCSHDGGGAARAHAGLGQYDVPEGGYFVWLRLPGWSRRQGAARARPTSMASTCAMAPSSRRWGAGQPPRLSYAFYDDDDIAEGVARLGGALQSLSWAP